MPILLVFVIICLSTQVQSKSKFFSTQSENRKYAATNPTGKNLLGMNSRKSSELNQKKNNIINQNLLQNKSKNQQYLTPEESDLNPKSYDKEDFYLWEEGVSNLAYDDFLTTKFVTNIEYLGAGYNVAYGNPLSTTSIDPGYRVLKAFEYHYQADKLKALSGDADYFLPDGMTLNTQTSCKISFDSTEMSTIEDYEKSLSIGAHMSYKGWGFRFQASGDYKKTNSYFQQDDSLMISTQANCDVHQLQISPFDQPKWSKQLNAAIKKLLKNTQDPYEYWQFFENFGTHISEKVKLGSKFGYMYEMSKKEVETMKAMGLSVSAAGGGWGVSLSGQTSFQKNSQNAFKSATKSWRSFSIGAPPDPDNDGLKWASQALDNPMPTSVSLIDWSDFFVKYKQGNTEFTDGEIHNLRRSIIKYQNSYCSVYLKSKYVVDSCFDSSITVSNLNEKGNPNVYGNKLLPQYDYTQSSGNSGYNWTKWGDFDNLIEIASDELGYIYALLEDNSLQKFTPYDQAWSQVDGEFKSISAGNGFIAAISTDNKLYFRNMKQQESNWEYMTDAIGPKVVMNSKGHILNIGTYDTSAKKQKVLQFRESLMNYHFHNYNYGWDENNYFMSGTRFIFGQGQYITGYDMSSGWMLQHMVGNRWQYYKNTNPSKSLCVTDANWGYSIQEDNEVYYNVFKRENQWIIENVAQNVKAKKISCSSSEEGPYVYIIGFDGNIYKRTI